MDLKEELLSSENIYQGRVIDLSVDTVRLPNGKTAVREFVQHKQAVAILPVQNNGRVILIRQYRHCTGEELWEIPAGSIDDGEDIESAVQRELAEEIGYTAQKLTKLCSAYTTPGFTSEFTHFYVATDLLAKREKADEDEFIEVKEFSWPEVLKMLEDNTIKDAKTVLAVAYHLLRQEKHR